MKKLLAFLLVFCVMAGGFAVSADHAAAGALSFTDYEIYQTTSAPKNAPKTFEAWIEVDKNASSGRLGILLGNYGGASNFSPITFEIRNNGNPYIYWNGQNAEFTEVDMRTGEKLHLALVIGANQAHCYINGELKQSVAISFPLLAGDKMNKFVVGGDYRNGNEQYLKSTKIHSLAIYSAERTADQVKSDMTSIDSSDTTLLAAYDLTLAGDARLADKSANKNNLTYTNKNAVAEGEAYAEGYLFHAADSYRMEEISEKLPVTFEAEICFPTDMAKTERGGVVIGNYGATTRCINFEIYTNGAPRIYWVDGTGQVKDLIFGMVNVYTGEWIHLAIVLNGSSMMCYVNGELKQTVISGALSQMPNLRTFCVGGDLRSGNTQYFKGGIKSVAMYEDARTADEIRSDMTNGYGKDGLIAAYDLTGAADKTETFADKSDNGNDLKLYTPWMDSIPENKDYAYSFAVVGDTQVLAEYHPEDFHYVYDWLVDNVAKRNIKCVLGLGDITNSDTTAEWALATQHISRLNGLVPYSLVRGNHDSSEGFTNAFKDSPYVDLLGGRYENTLENTWQELVVGETKYLIMTLDYGASDEVLSWAGDVIEAHPDHRVIITTHAYLFRDGTTLDANDVFPPTATGGYNNGDHIWTKLASQYENIQMVISGHDPCDNIVVTQSKGVKGNLVTQMLVDPQGVDSGKGPSGLVALLCFSEDGKKVWVEYYSTVREKYFMPENQFVINLEAAPSAPVSSQSTSENKSESASVSTDGGDNTKMIIVIVAGVIVLGAAAAVLVGMKKKKAKAQPAAEEETAAEAAEVTAENTAETAENEE